MTAQSMTGFARHEKTFDQSTIVVEIKSVNHRFKDLRFRMPSFLNSIEIDLRKLVEKHFQRGSFDIYITERKVDVTTNKEIDGEKVLNFLKKTKEWAMASELDFRVNPTDFFRSEFLVELDEKKIESMSKRVKETFSETLEKLSKARAEEGSKLVATIINHIEKYRELYKRIEPLAGLYKEGVETKLRTKFQEFQDEIKVEESRFLQEVVYYMEKLDIHEEINRIDIHLNKFLKICEKRGIGREIEFLLQELNRETNTIGSKSGNQEISNIVVQMKVQLEKIREQALNIE